MLLYKNDSVYIVTWQNHGCTSAILNDEEQAYCIFAFRPSFICLLTKFFFYYVVIIHVFTQCGVEADVRNLLVVSNCSLLICYFLNCYTKRPCILFKECVTNIHKSAILFSRLHMCVCVCLLCPCLYIHDCALHFSWGWICLKSNVIIFSY